MLALIKSSICRKEIPLKSIKGKKFGVFVDTISVAIACSFCCDVNPYLFSYFLIVATASVVAVAIVFAFAGVVVSDVLECLEYHRVLRFFSFAITMTTTLLNKQSRRYAALIYNLIMLSPFFPSF